MSVMRLLIAVCSCAVAAFAHEGEPLQPHDLWEAWVFPPGVVIPLVLSAWLYASGSARMSAVNRREQLCWWLGWVALTLSLVSPIHPLGEALFSAHMVQHEILMVVAAPLLVLGRPLVPFLFALPESWRRPVGRFSTRWWIAQPGPAAVIHGITLWLWHAPALFESTLRSDFMHSLQHISFLVTALLFWWGLFERDQAARAVLYLFLTTVHTGILGALLTFSSTLWYPAYSGRSAPWGLTALEDQQLGGLIMWVPASITYIVAALVLSAHILRRAGARVTTLMLLLGLCAGCSSQDERVQAFEVAGGNWRTGRDKIQYYGCGSCHTIPGVAGAHGLTGPPLTKFAKRMYVAGVLQNTPENLQRWIRDPKAVDKLTAMPRLFVTPSDARDIATFLYTLQ
jgi:cytochrome c oxidase assembly factor CtaG